jgi:hypothetical protein
MVQARQPTRFGPLFARMDRMRSPQVADPPPEPLLVWSLANASREHSLCCVLQTMDDHTFLATVHLDGHQIARRRLLTRSDAVRIATALLEQFAGLGWIVITGLPRLAVH